jgi:hypothetical protein
MRVQSSALLALTVLCGLGASDAYAGQEPYLSLPRSTYVSLSKPCGAQLDALQAAGLDVQVFERKSVAGTSYTSYSVWGPTPTREREPVANVFCKGDLVSSATRYWSPAKDSHVALGLAIKGALLLLQGEKGCSISENTEGSTPEVQASAVLVLCGTHGVHITSVRTTSGSESVLVNEVLRRPDQPRP